MSKAAQQLLQSFNALPKPDQHEVLVKLLRMPIEAEYTAPSEDELRHAANQVFLEMDKSETDK
jgi:hypothetical protein